MRGLGNLLKSVFSGRSGAHDQTALAELRARLAGRFLGYRNLLKANTRALTIMAELQEAQQHPESVSMPHLRSAATEMAVSVLAMIQELERLAPGRYPALMTRFNALKQELDQLIAAERRLPQNPLVIELTELGEIGVRVDELAGPKMATLAQLGNQLGLKVPDGFVITTAAYNSFVEHNGLRAEINRLLQITGLSKVDELFAACSALQRLFTQGELPPELDREMTAACQRLVQRHGPELKLAVRSSALGEDVGAASFAGQFRTELNVTPAALSEAYREVIASAYSPEALSYYHHYALRDQDLAMAVGCLVMLPARAGGVVYSASPLDPADGRVRISACWGLPKGVVDGSAEAEEIVVDTAGGVLERRAGHQDRIYQCDPSSGVLSATLPAELRNRSPLSDEAALELAIQAKDVEAAFGRPQDLEWALNEAGRLVYLQCRPLHRPASEVSQPSAEGLPDPIISGGLTAAPGAAAGVVQWVHTGRDALIFRAGQVLVVERPLPRWAPLLNWAVALVAGQGGVAGHLATVAREFGVPALVNLGSGLERLKPGELITVDADRRAVYPGRVEGLVRARPRLTPPPTAVGRTLERLIALAVPLNLLDPGSAEFRAANCRTLHDLTRFCHEQAVHEIFSMDGQAFPMAAVKQLYCNTPMQWRLIDIGGGFTEEVSGKYVRLEQIASRPWLALWEGMLAVPWDGPPITGSGLASVIMQSTMRPDLEVGAAWEEGNYFLVGRDFMNLQSRLGAHFAAVEVLAGPDAEENFVLFTFQGGGADMARKQARLRLMAEPLEDCGFAVSIRADTARARRDHLSDVEALASVQALGYLMIHTRQLDMAMADAGLVAHFTAKLRADLANLLRARGKTAGRSS
jgi:pyruvate,water dikinase